MECGTELQRSINIVDLIGNTFFQGEMHGLQKEISIRNWNRGIYFVTIKSSKQTVVKKVIVF
ncbi:T9SS type A sorting domain-containing protein [bacterium]|nr:T9SS type A sorting domain-containing protein [bacterium]